MIRHPIVTIVALGILLHTGTVAAIMHTYELNNRGIYFGFSGPGIQGNTTNANATCNQETVFGRPGRLARSLNPAENALLLALKGSYEPVMMDGTDRPAFGGWHWAPRDYSVDDSGEFYWNPATNLADGQVIPADCWSYCPWGEGEPYILEHGESPLQTEFKHSKGFVAMRGDGLWIDVYDEPHSFFCEFPCRDISDCPAPGPCETVRCEFPNYRCEYPPRPAGYLCGESNGFCDAPERCNGLDGLCRNQNQGACNDDRIVSFWWSQGESATPAQAAARCATFSYQGKTGRLARATSWWENDRMKNLKGPGTAGWLDGSDAGHEGSFRWSDGTTFWDNTGCKTDYCPWDANQPDNYQTGESQLEMWGDTGMWNDNRDDAVHPFFCEFPCAHVGQCPAPQVCETVVCSAWGRCLYTNKPDGTICFPSTGDCDGAKRCDGVSNLCRNPSGVCNTDRIITFWWSQHEHANPVDAAARCQQISYQGKTGRLARVTSWWENDRINTAKGSGTTMLDGSDAGHEGSWRWSNGVTFWDNTGCKIDYCPWDTNQPSNSFVGEHQVEMWGNGKWNDMDSGLKTPYSCEFPCTNAGQCPAPEPCETVVCSPWGRCLYSPKANGVICRAAGGDCDGPERCDGSSNQCPPQNGLCSTDRIMTFWWSQNEATTLAQAVSRCQQVSYQGKTGRLARVTSWWENDRMQNLKGWGTTAVIDGSDAGHEGSFRWSDGFTFWDNTGCKTEYCPWDTYQPDNYYLGENALVIWGNGKWNDYDGLVPWSYMCEFPCTNAGQCPAPGPCENVWCSGWGRCLYSGGC